MDVTTHLWTSAVVFAATDIDDLVLLTAFFADTRMRRGAIVAGQFLGIGALTAASAVAALAALAVPPHWPSLLGVIPLAMGLWKAWELIRDRAEDDDEAGDARRATARSGPQVLIVAAVTMANGGDNLSVYIPLFASNPRGVPVFVVVFAVMTALWCAAAHAFVKHPAGAAMMQRFGHWILPAVLIALGTWILRDARQLF
ncbi:MAG TPA: cadmium resistance transporter [Steroidobacteraceae bacterium]